MQKKYFNRGREGLQTTSYLCEDGETVLKLFKSFADSEKQLISRGKPKEELEKDRHSNGIISAKIASDKIPTLTGIIQFHDGTTDIGKIFIDNHINETLGLPFVIQEKTTLVCELIQNCLERGDIDGATKVLDDVFQLIRDIRRKGITEDTFNYDHNYGYNNVGRMIQIDIGSFWSGKKYIRKQIKDKELLNIDRNQTINRLKRKSVELYNYHVKKSNELYTEFENY